MRAAIKLFLILITLVVILFSWITHQLGNPKIQFLIIILIAISILAFLILNILDHREQKRRREARESNSAAESPSGGSDVKRSDTSFALREKRSGLTWGGGNIKASEATRGTKRKFLGR